MLITCHPTRVPGRPSERPPPLTIALDDPRAYGESFAETYDAWYSTTSDAAATARFVAARCGDRPVLELGVGTGRLATPLCRLGVTVIGLDASGDMLSRCPTEVLRIQADMSRPPIRPGGRHTVLWGFNTIFNLASAQAQQDALRHLRPITSTLIIETMGTDALAGQIGSAAGRRAHDAGGVVVTATTVDADAQVVVGSHLEISDEAVVARPWKLRWLTVSQLDQLAATAGFSLEERFRSWHETPWTTDPVSPERGSEAEPDVAISVFR